MKLAIVHYHLDRGGVTQVIVNHLRALDGVLAECGERLHVAILFGGRSAGWPTTLADELSSVAISLHTIAELEYDQSATANGRRLADRICETLAEAGLEREQTVVQIHNHSLGKNASVPVAIAELARDGYRLLLQIHDFAEDFRPANYGHLEAALGTADAEAMAETLYPQVSQIHYAALNGRDLNLLRSAGVP